MFKLKGSTCTCAGQVWSCSYVVLLLYIHSNSYGHVGAVGDCKTLILGSYFILAILAVKARGRKYVCQH